MDIFWSAPPISRTLAAAALGMSLLVYATPVIDMMSVIFYLPRLQRLPPELWRLVTSFLLTGPQLSILIDPYLLYTYGSSLETGSGRFGQPGDFLTYVMFVCSVILALHASIFSGYVLTPALLLAMAYTYAQDNRGRMTSFIVITIPIEWLPYAILLVTLLLNGQNAMLSQFTGLLAAHLYDFLTRIWPMHGGGQNYIQTPTMVSRWFGADQPSVRHTSAGTAYRPAGVSQSGQDPAHGARSSGFTAASNVWGSRGSGHRLGGD